MIDDPTVDDPSDPAWYTFEAWCRRELPGGGVPIQGTNHLPDGTTPYDEARYRWSRWVARTYDTSPAGRAAARDLSERTTRFRPHHSTAPAPELEPVSNRVALQELLAIVDALSDVVAFTVALAAPERQPRQERALDEIGARVTRLRTGIFHGEIS